MGFTISKGIKMVCTTKTIVNGVLICLCLTMGNAVFAQDNVSVDALSPVVQKLSNLYWENPTLLNRAFESAITPPTGQCSMSPVTGEPFCWHDKNINDLLFFFESWLHFTPTPQKDGFGYYQLFYDFCYNNRSALEFVETSPKVNG